MSKPIVSAAVLSVAALALVAFLSRPVVAEEPNEPGQQHQQKPPPNAPHPPANPGTPHPPSGAPVGPPAGGHPPGAAPNVPHPPGGGPGGAPGGQPNVVHPPGTPGAPGGQPNFGRPPGGPGVPPNVPHPGGQPPGAGPNNFPHPPGGQPPGGPGARPPGGGAPQGFARPPGGGPGQGFGGRQGGGHPVAPAHDFRGRDFQHFSPRDREVWEHGNWRQESHDGRFGWWWETGGLWYFFAQPIYPFPTYVPDIYYQPEEPDDYAPDPGTQYWYYCSYPPGYYPYVQSCPTPWQPVPAQ